MASDLVANALQERIDLVVFTEERRKAGGLSAAVVVSVVLHAALLIWFARSYGSIPAATENVPIARYVELIKQQPPDFVEAPGPAIDRAPSPNAAFSDENRRASMPRPTGDTPTNRPGDGGGIFTPPTPPPGPRGPSQPAVAPSPAAQPMQQPGAAAPAAEPHSAPADPLVYREPVQANASAAVDLRKAISDFGRAAVAGGGGGNGPDFARIGGEKGFAEQGPLSFETQWYDWGDYAQSMVSKIRVNWYSNMPQIIRTGMKGVVTIRFTIQRDGRITDITILESSGIPPYDQAARKAIELSSPLKPLPADFPNPSERVTCMFYYNMEIPRT